MEYEEYVRKVAEADALVERGEYQRAGDILRSLVESDLAPKDKAMMCLNLAIVCDRQGEVEEALRWYERGMAYERLAGGHFVEERRALYLAEKGRIAESLFAYRTLLSRPSLAEGEKVRIQHNIRLLEERLGEQAT